MTPYSKRLFEAHAFGIIENRVGAPLDIHLLSDLHLEHLMGDGWTCGCTAIPIAILT